MKKVAMLFFVVSGMMTATGQNTTDTLVLKKVWGSYQFYQNDTKLTFREVVGKMKPNEQAYLHIKSAQRNKTWSTIIGSIGGFMVGWPLGTAIGGGDPNWTMAGIGAALIVVSIPINQKFNKHFRMAVDTYNANPSALRNKKEWDLSFKGNALSLKYKF